MWVKSLEYFGAFGHISQVYVIPVKTPTAAVPCNVDQLPLLWILGIYGFPHLNQV